MARDRNVDELFAAFQAGWIAARGINSETFNRMPEETRWALYKQFKAWQATPNPPRAVRAQKVISILEKSTMKEPPAAMLSPAHLVHYSLYEYIGKRANETFLAVYLNVQNIVVGFSEYTSGSMHEVLVTPSGMFRDALIAGAAAIITVHQHPSGVARPSDADEELWRRFRAIGELLGIPVIDNLVLGEDQFYSEAENRMTSYAQLRIMMK